MIIKRELTGKVQTVRGLISPDDLGVTLPHEHLFIDKSITLMGENRFTTIIDGDGYGKVIFVTGGNVTITGFTIQDGEYGIY